jgi:hypothetical protein
MACSKRQARSNFYRGEVLCHGKCDPMSQSRMLRRSQMLGQGTGVNVDGAGGSTKTIHRQVSRTM